MNSTTPKNILLSNFRLNARTINKIPIKIKLTAKLILKNGKLIGVKSKINQTIFTISTE